MPNRTPENELIAVAGARMEVPAVPAVVKLMPYGTYRGRDGQGPYTLADRAAGEKVVATSVAYQKGADYPVDYEHQTQMAARNGQPVIAAGWIKQLEARDDGIYARVDWTAAASQRLADKEIRYISPTFTHDRAGQVLRIVGAGLVALPNLEIPALAGQRSPPVTSPSDTPQGVPMDKILLALLGLAENATPEQIAIASQVMANGVKSAAKLLGLPETATAIQVATAAQGVLPTLTKALGIEGEATLATLATAAQDLSAKAKAAAQVDATKYIPMETYLAVASQLTQLQTATTQSEVTRAVDEAVAAGKVTPATKDHFLAMASQDLPAFRSLMAKSPVLVATNAQQPAGAQPPAQAQGSQQLSADELAVASQLGLTPEQYAKAKENK